MVQKKSKQKHLTFMVIPESSGMARQVRLPIPALMVGLGTLCLVLLAGFYFFVDYFGDRVAQAELEALRTENAQLESKFEQMRWNLAEVESRYGQLVQSEVQMRNLFDLPAVDPQERELGIGGPVSPAIATMSPAEKTALVTEQQVERLLTLSEYELQKYSEVESELGKIKRRLAHTPSIWPCKGWLSRGYGMKYDPFTGYKQMHRGLDLANDIGTPVVATADGVVESVRTNGALGKSIVINHGYGFKTRFGHLSKYEVKKGQKVKRGDLVALMGKTGRSTGSHLHYEVLRNGKFFDPRKYILNEK